MLKKLLIIFAPVLIITATAFSPIFSISKITIDQSKNCLSEDEVKSNLNNRNLIFLKTEILKKALSTKSCVKSINMRKFYPSKLQIILETKKAVAKLEDNINQLNEDGEVEKLTNSNLPTFYDSKLTSLKENQILNDPQLLKSLKIASALISSDLQTTSLRFVDDNFVAYDQQGLVVIFSPDKDPNSQVDSLQQVLAKTKIDATKIAKIDLRFDKPVILFK